MITVTSAKVKKIIEHQEDLREYLLIPEKYRAFRAGMFLQLTLDNVSASDYWPESRTFSISNSYDKSNPSFRLIIRRIGKYSSRIFNELKIGNSCTLKYAFGDMMLPKDENREIVCIAGGSGIAPFLSFVDECEKQNKINKLYILFSAKTQEEMLYKKKLSESLRFNFKPFTTRETVSWAQNRRISNDDVLALSENLSNPCFYICGSPGFITYFKNSLLSSGKIDIFTDEWE